MNGLLVTLRRIFWSLYGKLVWDDCNGLSASSPVIQVVGLLSERRNGAGEQVLDAGCGTGNYAVALARAGFQVTGIDYAAGMLARAGAKVRQAPAGSLSFCRASLDRVLPFPEDRFDHVLCVSVIQAVADPRLTLKEFRRVLRPRGTLLLLHYGPSDLHRLPFWREVRQRIAKTGVRQPWRVGLVALKSWAERSGMTRYWTATELQKMVLTLGYSVVSVSDSRPIILLAERSENGVG
jgi:ubiquinone/menaquinone biosynthesis C-methylase UbiE